MFMAEIETLKVVVVSGLSFSGKSTYIEWILSQPGLELFDVFRADDVRQELFGDAAITLPEHFFKNEEVWHRAKRKLVVDKKSVLIEMPLLDEREYHLPLWQMVQSSQAYLHRMRLAKERHKETFPIYRVHLLVISLFCDVKTVKARIEQRKLDQVLGKTKSDIFSLERMRVGVERFEFPQLFRPLYINTSQDVREPGSAAQALILNFLGAGIAPSDRDQASMINDAKSCLKELKGAVLACA